MPQLYAKMKNSSGYHLRCRDISCDIWRFHSRNNGTGTQLLTAPGYVLAPCARRYAAIGPLVDMCTGTIAFALSAWYMGTLKVDPRSHVGLRTAVS